MEDDEDTVMEELPPWMVAAVDQLIASIDDRNLEAVIVPGQVDVILTTLTEPPDDVPTEEWDFTCDCCGVHFPGNIRTGHVARLHKGVPIFIFWGACEPCLGLGETDGE